MEDTSSTTPGQTTSVCGGTVARGSIYLVIQRRWIPIQTGIATRQSRRSENMPNPFTSVTRDAFYQQETGENFIVLITITHPSIAYEPIRVAGNDIDVLSRGLTFYAYPFELQLPDSDPTQPSKAQLKIDNITPEILNTLRSLSTA